MGEHVKTEQVYVCSRHGVVPDEEIKWSEPAWPDFVRWAYHRECYLSVMREEVPVDKAKEEYEKHRERYKGQLERDERELESLWPVKNKEQRDRREMLKERKQIAWHKLDAINGLAKDQGLT